MRGIVRGTELPSRYGGVTRIMPAAEKKGNEKGFDQRERVAFSAYSFLKRVGTGRRREARAQWAQRRRR